MDKKLAIELRNAGFPTSTDRMAIGDVVCNIKTDNQYPIYCGEIEQAHKDVLDNKLVRFPQLEEIIKKLDSKYLKIERCNQEWVCEGGDDFIKINVTHQVLEQALGYLWLNLNKK